MHPCLAQPLSPSSLPSPIPTYVFSPVNLKSSPVQATLLFANVPYSAGVDFFFQFVFCATSATIFAGAVAERTQLTAYLLFK